jgi:hypothetical protein
MESWGAGEKGWDNYRNNVTLIAYSKKENYNVTVITKIPR